MQVKRISFIFLFAGCLLLFAAVFMSRGIYEKMEELNGSVSMRKVSISVRDSTGINGGQFFSISEIDRLQKLLNTGIVYCSAQVFSQASYGNSTARVRVSGTNELAPLFCSIRIQKGSFFSEADNNEKSRVVVIDDRMAWKLFNNDDVLGHRIDLFGSGFKIIGIAESEQSAVGKLVDGGSMQVYVPIGTYLDLNMGPGISYFQYETPSDSTIGGNTEDMGNALAALGKDRNGYHIVDYNIKAAVLRQKPDLLIFLMGLFVMAAMLVYCANRWRKTIHLIRNECKSDYLANAILTHRHEILGSLASVIFAAACSVLIWRLIRFGFFISPELIPDDLSDLSYFSRLLQQKISLSLSNAGYVSPFPELISNTAEAVFNWVFYTGFLIGALLFCASLVLIRREATPPEKVIPAGGVFLAADAGIVLLLSLTAGLPVVMEWKAISIFWTFIFTGLLLASSAVGRTAGKNHGLDSGLYIKDR